jgi:site-specific DNA recombinase
MRADTDAAMLRVHEPWNDPSDLLRNQIHAGIVNVPEYGVRGKRGDFTPLISEELFYRVQAILSGLVPSTAPRKRAHPDFPLRGLVAV